MRPIIEDYAMIGDGETCALISRFGSIDFLCWPRFDSSTCFAALLGDASHGHWSIATEVNNPIITRRYDGDTLILETEFRDGEQAFRITDFMPIRNRASSVIRVVDGIAGTCRLRMSLAMRFDYGTMRPWSRLTERGLLAELGPARVVLDSAVPVILDDSTAYAVFEVSAGQRLSFVLSYADSSEEVPPVLDVDECLEATKRFWLDWIGRFDKPCLRPEMVRRSLITLKALIHQRTGGLIAAATFGLPEKPRGNMNWDYRYTWIRDATFTLAALLNAGFKEEATAWQDWLARAAGGDPTKLQIVYRIDGSREMHERQAPKLIGYEGAKPILIGNEAADQMQLDVYGELVNAIHLAERGGLERNAHSFDTERLIIEYLDRHWNDPGADIWEVRDEPRHYTYSQVMAWVAMEQFLRSDEARRRLDATTLKRLTRTRDAIHEMVCRKGYDEQAGHFVRWYGTDELDASLLLLPLVGFLPITDYRITSTITSIERHLLKEGFVRRNVATTEDDEEGAFLACSCWLADCWYLAGRHDDAQAMIDRVIGIANDVGLLAEEYHVPTRRLIGNMPQALSHLALINSVLLQSGNILQRS